MREHAAAARSGTFLDNQRLPIHRWFKYSAGYSAEWVRFEIDRFRRGRGCTPRVLDPFVGSGTTLIAADGYGAPSLGIEAQPFVARVARAKSNWDVDLQQLQDAFAETLDTADAVDGRSLGLGKNRLLGKCYTPAALEQLGALRVAYGRLPCPGPCGSWCG